MCLTWLFRGCTTVDPAVVAMRRVTVELKQQEIQHSGSQRPERGKLLLEQTCKFLTDWASMIEGHVFGRATESSLLHWRICFRPNTDNGNRRTMGSLIWASLVTEKHKVLIEGVCELQCSSCLPACAQPGMMVYHLVLCSICYECGCWDLQRSAAEREKKLWLFLSLIRNSFLSCLQDFGC